MPGITRESVIETMQEAADRMGLDLEDLQEMINEVLEDCKGKAIRLKDAIMAADAASIKSIAHDIKGSTANYGLKTASALALEIEKNNEKAPLPVVEELITLIEDLSKLGLDEG